MVITILLRIGIAAARIDSSGARLRPVDPVAVKDVWDAVFIVHHAIAERFCHCFLDIWRSCWFALNRLVDPSVPMC